MALEHYELAREMQLIRYPEWSPMRKILQRLDRVGAEITHEELLTIVRAEIFEKPNEPVNYTSMVRATVEQLHDDMSCAASEGHWSIQITHSGGVQCVDVARTARNVMQNALSLCLDAGVKRGQLLPDYEELEGGRGI